MRVLVCLAVASGLVAPAAAACAPPSSIREASPAAVRAYFAAQRRTVLTFVGYSGAGYEDGAAMLDAAARVLDGFAPARTIVNIGATADGIGAVYELAKRRGFRTSGVVSTQARVTGAALSPCVDVVLYVQDDTWGGQLPDGKGLSPTSQAMVESSDVMVAIGGGEVARDELMAAKRAGRRVRFIPADMSHRVAREKAEKKGLPPPTEFGGAVAAAFPDAPSRAASPRVPNVGDPR